MTALASRKQVELVRAAAVEITDGDGAHHGVGLALDVPGKGPVVLTCHHVIAPMAQDVRVVFHDGSSRQAALDEAATDFERDAAVVTVEDPPPLENPRLHVPAPEIFTGPLSGTAYSPGAGAASFSVTLEAGELDRVIRVPYEPGRYVLPKALHIKTDDSREGVSGSPVYCEDGVVGLVHAGRDESPGAARVAYAGPLTAWQDRLPGLADLLEPFATRALRGRATVCWATEAPERKLHVPGHTVSYLARPEDDEARTRLEQGVLCLVGRHNTGKSRLVSQLLRDTPDAVVVMPTRLDPPDLTKESDLGGRKVVLVFDNVHVAPSAWGPLKWLDGFQGIAEQTALVVTAWNKEKWETVKTVQSDLFDAHPTDPVYLGKDDGRDLEREEGWRLAQEIGMDRETFDDLFDGTPGSVLVPEDAPPPPSGTVPDGELAGTAIRAVTEEHAATDVPTNLPEITSTFVGRTNELAAIKGMLAAGALVTLTGPNGVGKTRLAIHAGKELAGDFPDGVWFADLSTVRDEQVLPRIVGRSVGEAHWAIVQSEDALVDHLRGRRALVILNGPELVMPGAARLAGRLTEGAASLRVLVTAETGLGIPWENVLSLQPLSSSQEAPELFLDRSGLTRSETAMTAEQRSRVETLYRDQEGNAAALEITAAHVRSSGVTGAVDASARRPAAASDDVLRLAVTSSLHDLTEADAATFVRIAVMPDWFTLDAARTVATGGPVVDGQVPEHLRALIDRSLILIDVRDAESQRFRLLPAVREIAVGLLDASGEFEAVARRHADHYLAAAQQASARLQGRSARRWLARLEADQQHFRAALAWSMTSDRSTALALCSALWLPCIMRSNFAEARRLIADVVATAMPDLGELPPADVATLADVLIGAGYLAYHQADYADAEAQLEKLEAVKGRPGAGSLHADDVNLRGLIARRRCQFEAALSLLTRAAEASGAEGDMPRLADRLNTLGNTIRERAGHPADDDDPLATAGALQEQSLGVYARLGDERGGAMVQCDLAYVLLDRGDLAGARPLLEESLATRVQIKDAQGEAQSMNGLGRLEREEGDLEAAIDHHERALELFERVGDALRIAETWEALGLALLAQGHEAEGQAHVARGQVVRDQYGAPRPPVLVRALQAMEVPAGDGAKPAERFRREARRVTAEGEA